MINIDILTISFLAVFLILKTFLDYRVRYKEVEFKQIESKKEIERLKLKCIEEENYVQNAEMHIKIQQMKKDGELEE